MSTVQSQNIIKASATSSLTPPPHARKHQIEVAKLIDTSVCTGCKACQVACSEWNDLRAEQEHCLGTYANPANTNAEQWTVIKYNEVEENGHLEWLIRKSGCMHCEDPGCLKACPSPGAIIQYENGIVDFQSDKCIGCGYCIAGCPFDVPRMNPKDNRVYKCNLCIDRVAVGQEPACAKSCTTGAIKFGTKADMLQLANMRVAQLKERGFPNAGIYNPEGVGGTHVMYVLAHADKPELYSGLAKDPEISPTVKLWKDFLKPVAAVAFGGLALAEIAHYIAVGPNTEDLDEHEDETINNDEIKPNQKGGNNE